jgi:hypothetical protein
VGRDLYIARRWRPAETKKDEKETRKMRKTPLLAIAAAAVLAPDVMTATPGVTAFDQQTTAEYRAMGECLAGQVRTRGWVGHGPKNRIVIAAALSMVISPVMAAEADNADNPKGAQEFPIMDIDAATLRQTETFFRPKHNSASWIHGRGIGLPDPRPLCQTIL